MTIKHRHPPFPGQEQYAQQLRDTLTSCLKKLHQADDRRASTSNIRKN